MGPIEGHRAPRTLVEQVASDAVDFVEKEMIAGGAVLAECLLVVGAKNVPEGELNSTTTGYGFMDETELLSDMVARTVECATRLGLELDIEIKGGEFGWGQVG